MFLKFICMKRSIVILNVSLLFAFTSCNGQADTTQISNLKSSNQMKTEYNSLTPQQYDVLVNKATDRPYTGEYYQKKDHGIYICRQCNAPLYQSADKFDSHCGWPSFDDEIAGSVKRIADADGMRIEIVCNNCQGHLGHVFEGERFTAKNTRHCVNTSSIVFYPSSEMGKLPEVIVLKK
jgi:peptide-methionine (R)-S-oxide reductase